MTPKRRKILKVVGAGVVLILLITSPLMVRAYRQTREFNRAFEAYSTAIRNGSFQSAYDMADAEFKAATSYSAFTQIHKSLIGQFGELSGVKQESAVVEGRGTPTDWFAISNATLQFQHGAVEFKYSFHLSDGAWKLHGFERAQ
jgi:hypothetical protein